MRREPGTTVALGGYVSRIVGFAAGVLHECHFEPASIGTVVAVPGACLGTSSASVVAGRLIVPVESVADTASVVSFARR